MSTQFYESLKTAKPEGDFLELQVPGDRDPRRIYIRKAYKALHYLIHEGDFCAEHSIIVTGNPGVGKSWFCMFEIYSLIQKFPGEYSAIVVQNLNLGIHCVFTKDGMETGEKIVKKTLFSKSDQSLLYLFDCATQKGEPQLSRARTIVFSSPQPRNNYQDFQKERDPVYLYMPPWSLEELKTVNGDGNVDEKFRIFGGIPRYVFGQRWTEEQLKRQVAELTSDDLYKLASDVTVHHSTHISHKIFQLRVKDDDYSKMDVYFASEFVLELIKSQIKFTTRCSLVKAINAGEFEGTGYLGQLFEVFAHLKLIEGGQFQRRPLSGDQLAEDLVIKDHKVVIFNGETELKNAISAREKDVLLYLKPKQGNFESIDSLLIADDMNIGFQVTTDSAHGVKKRGLDKVCKCLGEDSTLHVYFVVPEYNFLTYPLQNYVGVHGKKLESQSYPQYKQSVVGMKLFFSD